MKIPIEKVLPNPDQPRTIFDEMELHALAQSIQNNDLIQPIIVEPAGDQYILVDGERRLRAVKILEWKEIEAVVRKATNHRRARGVNTPRPRRYDHTTKTIPSPPADASKAAAIGAGSPRNQPPNCHSMCVIARVRGPRVIARHPLEVIRDRLAICRRRRCGILLGQIKLSPHSRQLGLQ